FPYTTFFFLPYSSISLFFFFTDPPTTEIYTLSLHDALPICHTPDCLQRGGVNPARRPAGPALRWQGGDYPDWHSVLRPRAAHCLDRKSTRLNSSHVAISYAVFCLKKKKKKNKDKFYVRYGTL